MAMEVLKIFRNKLSYFTMLYRLTTNECFLSSFSGDGQKFVYGFIIFVDRFFIPLTVAEILLLNQENLYVMFN